MEELNVRDKRKDTICAPATPHGESAIGMVRVSGSDAVTIVDEMFVTKEIKTGILRNAKAGTMKHGLLLDSNKNIIDEVICSVFLAPNSYTGENVVEISHHGSVYVQQQIIISLINKGVRVAANGEFSLRAFLNGKMDLSQAEAVADLIHARTAIAHDLAIKQLRGGYRNVLSDLRNRLVNLLSLLELELDFSEENVEFAKRSDLKHAMTSIRMMLTRLIDSFATGNAFKNGIPIAIIGKPNSGKSTLLNAILNEERSIVSSISGTTRDTVEEVIQLNGVEYRFIDTAGIRHAVDRLESEGIKRSYQAVERARIIIYVVDLTQTSSEEVQSELVLLDTQVPLEGKKILIVGNKIDMVRSTRVQKKRWDAMGAMQVSAKQKLGINEVVNRIVMLSDQDDVRGKIMVTNARHYDAMRRALAALLVAEESFDEGMSMDLIASDIREVLHYLGEITGEVTTEEILNNIFDKFCIGK